MLLCESLQNLARIDHFSAIEFSHARIHKGTHTLELSVPMKFLILQQPKRSPDHFTGGLVST